MLPDLYKLSDSTIVSEQQEINETFKLLSQHDRLLPIKVSPFYQRKVDEEVRKLGHTRGPLHRIAYPSLEKISLHTSQEQNDFVDDRGNMPSSFFNTIIQKYADRVIFFIASKCISNCQYCFRQDVLADTSSKYSTIEEKLLLLERYLRENSKITEVILSGGDPMTLSYSELETVLNRLKKLNLSSIRIHTRSLIYNPEIFNNDKLLALLKKTNVRLVFHIVHPYELCDEVVKIIGKINGFAIHCYNQFPILRNINDHVEVLLKHLTKLDELHIRNLSIFYPDAVKYSAAFRIRFKRLFNIMDEFNWRTPSWINATKFTLDTPFGKVQRENLQGYDDENNIAVFCRDGKIINYPDLPEHLDVPGKLEMLLWGGGE